MCIRDRAVIMRQALGLPAQKVVQHTGVGADVVAGNHAGIQKPGQGVHQFQSHTVMALCGNPDRNPDVRCFDIVIEFVDIRRIWIKLGSPGITDILIGSVAIAIQFKQARYRKILPLRIIIVRCV